ncbi:hypothetical protein BS78_04G207000 [Paspalum vaginatum]|nr:hypothetical protein BS78_04G207000 [Paspalum vaginatum]
MQAPARLSSSTASKRVIAGVSSTITRSCYRTTRGKAHAAPLSAQEPPPKGQKKITKQERRARIVEFVDNFRASNDGKFPTITSVRRQAGGSHYTVRDILQELEYNAKLPPGNAKAGPLQEMAEVAEHSRPSDEAKVAQLQGTAEVAETSRPNPEDKVSQLQGASQFTEHSKPKGDIVENPYNCDSFKSSEEIQDANDMLISQEAATRTGIVEKTETWTSVGSHPYNVETEATKHAMDTSETCKTADGRPTSSDQTESESMNNKLSVSLREEAKSDLGNQQREREANKSDVKNTKESLNASEPSVSDQSGCDKVFEANTHDREHNQKPEPEESANMGLFGSLKSFANGIKNFWRKL